MGSQANEFLEISPAGIALIKKWEGWYPKAYKDPVGVWTIGWGTTGIEARPGRTITKKQGDAFLKEELDEVADQVRAAVKIALTQHQFDALVSFTYNVGIGNLKRSTLLRLINRGNFIGAAGQFARWNKARDRATNAYITLRGLTNRRRDEALLFQLDDDENPPWDLDTEKAAPLDNPQSFDGNVQPDTPSNNKFAFKELITGTDTFKALAASLSGLILTISQAVAPLAEQPLLLAGISMAVGGILSALWIKYRDTSEGR